MYRYFDDNFKGFIIENGVLRKILISLEELNSYVRRNTELNLIFCKTLLFLALRVTIRNIVMTIRKHKSTRRERPKLACRILCVLIFSQTSL